MAITYILGGNEASPFYSIGLGLIANMFGDEDDEDEDEEFMDWDNWVKNYVEKEIGGAAGDLFLEMGMSPDNADKLGDFVGGSLQRGLVTELTGGDLSSRVSIDPKSLFFREGRYSPDVRADLIETTIANLGPTLGLGLNFVESYKLFQQGEYQRAFEKAAPAILAKPVTAARLSEEGAKTARGDELIAEFSSWELAMQAIGLQPTRLQQRQKSSIEAVQKEQKIKARKKMLLDRLWMERDSYEGYEDVMERINEFNAKVANTNYAGFAIDGKTIQESFSTREEGMAQAENIGARVSKEFIPEALQMMRYGRPD
jgi:hypothetical protein